jgi:mRNA-degrading endonuclease toxin of MazEF toxin-antitoxin module
MCGMQKKLTITIDEEDYEGLHKTIAPRKISRNIHDFEITESKAMADQLITVSKLRLFKRAGVLSVKDMQKIDAAVKVQLDIL